MFMINVTNVVQKIYVLQIAEHPLKNKYLFCRSLKHVYF